MPKRDWEERYRSGDLPWDTGEPDEHLVSVVESRPVRAGRVLEIGCGTGTNAVWLATRGFDVVGIDLSAVAIEMARAKAKAVKMECAFERVDFLRDDLPAATAGSVGSADPFDFIFDRGCFHVFDAPEDRTEYARRVDRLLGPGGLWLSIIGSTEGPERDHGPPRRTMRDIAEAIEPALEIVEVQSVILHANTETPPRAWRCLAAKRSVPAQPSTRD